MLARPHIQHLVERARMLPATPTAFVYPCDADSLQLALSGSFAGFVDPLLVGPEGRIRDTADRAGLDISRIPVRPTEDSPRDAAAAAVACARAGQVRALLRGTLGNDEMLAPVAAPDSGLRTDRRLSFAHFIDLPGHPRGLLFGDALLNVTPGLAAKRDILANMLDFARALGIAIPAAAVLAATGHANAAFPSTSDALALKSMAEEGFFPGAVVEGPLTADAALSVQAARENGISGAVAGNADVLLAPGMEAASLMLRTLLAVSEGFAAGLVLGARVPIVMPARGDSMEVRIAACVLASLHANRAPRDAHAGTPSLRGRNACSRPDEASL